MDMIGGEDRVTYTVEIDLSQARQAADQLADLFEQRLASMRIELPTTAGAQAPAQIARQAEQAADQAAASFERIGQIDLTRPADELRRELDLLQRTIAATEDQLEKMAFTSGSFGAHTGRFDAQLEEYYRQLEFDQGREAANRARARGVVGSLGQINAQFINDEIPEEEFSTRVQRDVVEKHRQTLDEQRQAAELAAEIYEQRLQAIAIERAILTQQAAELDEYVNQVQARGGDLDEATATEWIQAQARLAEATKDWQAQEADLMESMIRSREEAARIAERQAEQGKSRSQRAAEALAAPGPAAAPAGPAAYGGEVERGRYTAITVTQASAENAERLSQSLQEAAAATERIERLRAGNADQRREELQLARDKAQIDRQNARVIEQERQLEITAGESARDSIRQTQQARQAAHQKQILNARTAAQAQEQANRAAANQATAYARAEAAQRAALARTSAAQLEQYARAAANARIEQDRRVTAEFKQELRERDRAHAASFRQQQAGRAGAGGAAVPGWVGGLGRNLLYTGAGVLGVYGGEQILRGAYQMGTEGARAERIAQTYENVARRVGVSSAAMTAAIREASRGTIGDIDAIGLGAQVLAQRWAESSDDIIGDTAALVEASRRLAQLYTDEQGQFLTTQEVFARLVKFIREGNKELVDQFGLSNARIAEALDVSKEGLASSEGAALRFQGVVQLLTEDMAQLGQTSLTTADEIEAAEARIRTARTRMGQALAEPTATAAETGANAVERVSVLLFGTRDPATVARVLRQELERTSQANAFGAMLPRWMDPRRGARQEREERIEQLARGIETAQRAVEEGIPSAEEMRSQLLGIADEFIRTGAIGDEYAVMLARVSEWYDVSAAKAAEAAARTAETGAEARATAADLLELADEAKGAGGGFAFLAQMIASAGGTLEGFDADLAGLEGRLANVQEEAARRTEAEQGIGQSIIGAMESAISAGAMEPGAAQEQARSALARLEEAADQWAADRVTDPITIAAQAAELEAEVVKPFEMAVEQQREVEQAGEKAQREWEQAAKKAEREFEQAAKEAAAAFENALGEVPGLFGVSEVSEGDIADAEAGVYLEKADEYLRRLRDEVLNEDRRVDYAGVDIRDAAARIGVSPDLDPKAILRLFERQWASGELFANQQNLDLINRQAVMQSLASQRQAAAGRQNIIAHFGLDEQLTAVSGLGMPNDLFGPFAEQMAAQIPDAAGETAPAYVAAMQSSIADEIAGGAYTEQLATTGANLLDLIWGGYSDAIPDRPWVGALVDHVSTEVYKQLTDALPPA